MNLRTSMRNLSSRKRSMLNHSRRMVCMNMVKYMYAICSAQKRALRMVSGQLRGRMHGMASKQQQQCAQCHDVGHACVESIEALLNKRHSTTWDVHADSGRQGICKESLEFACLLNAVLSQFTQPRGLISGSTLGTCLHDLHGG